MSPCVPDVFPANFFEPDRQSVIYGIEIGGTSTNLFYRTTLLPSGLSPLLLVPTAAKKDWIQTAPGRRCFTYFRFYGPDKPFFEKTWKLPEIEESK